MTQNILKCQVILSSLKNQNNSEVMSHLITGTHSEKCIAVGISERIYTNLAGTACYTPGIYGIVCCC